MPQKAMLSAMLRMLATCTVFRLQQMFQMRRIANILPLVSKQWIYDCEYGTNSSGTEITLPILFPNLHAVDFATDLGIGAQTCAAWPSSLSKAIVCGRNFDGALAPGGCHLLAIGK